MLAIIHSVHTQGGGNGQKFGIASTLNVAQSLDMQDCHVVDQPIEIRGG